MTADDVQTIKDREASLAHAGRLQAQLVEQLKDLPVMVQLDALLAAYVHVGIQHRQLQAVAPALMALAGNLLFSEVKTVSIGRSADSAAHHAAPRAYQ